MINFELKGKKLPELHVDDLMCLHLLLKHSMSVSAFSTSQLDFNTLGINELRVKEKILFPLIEVFPHSC